jgi:hypothetical protein
MMPTDQPNPSDDDMAVRLQWPSDPSPTEDATSRQRFPLPPVDADADVDDGSIYSAAVVSVAGDATRPARSLIEAYDRLGDRVLERMRALREDVDADLTAVRSELATLRQAVDDVGDRVQLRQLRATIDELRGDVSGLRRAVIEWPELEQVSSDISGLRSDMSNVLAATHASDSSDSALSFAALAPLVEEIAQLRGEVMSLRRRISLRGQGQAVSVDDTQLERLADAVAERMAFGAKGKRR